MQKTAKNRKRKMSVKRRRKVLATAGIIAFSILVVLGIVYFVFRSRVKSTADNEIYNNVYIETVNVRYEKIRCQKSSGSKD
jgi:cbb3-type cytochrome oxidase subunit 3